MEEKTLLQSFAVNKAGKIISVHDVERGKACECCCPVCGEVLIARQGEIRSWHFAHESGFDCEGAAEGALHSAAKQIIVEHKRLLSPRLEVFREHILQDGRHGKYSRSLEPEEIELDDIKLERAIGSIRPDVFAMNRNGNSPIFIEIAVTHYSDEKKCDEIRDLNIACIEISLPPEANTEWTWDTIRESVLTNPENREWLYHPDTKKYGEEADRMALQNAYSKNSNPVNKERHRFRLFGIPVHIIKHGEWITLWIPYNDTIYPIIRNVACTNRYISAPAMALFALLHHDPP